MIIKTSYPFMKPPPSARLIRGHRLAQGLAGAWLFNEDSGNKVFDLSGNGYTGLFYSNRAIDFWRPQKFGSGLELNDFYDENVDLSSTGLVARPDTSGAIVMWIYAHDFGGIRCPIGWGYTAGGTYYLYVYLDTSGYLHIRQRNNDTADDIRTNIALSLNTFHQIAIVSNGSAYSLFIDGVRQALTIVSGANSGDWLGDTTLDRVIIGGRGSTGAPGDEHFDGAIDHVLIYNRVLNASEIAELLYNPFCMLERKARTALMSGYEVVAPPVGMAGAMTTNTGYWGY